MLGAFGKWLYSLTATAMVVSCLASITRGGMRKCVRLVGGTALAIVLMQPFFKPDAVMIRSFTDRYTSEFEEAAREVIDEGRKQVGAVIAEECEEYISTQAEKLGISCKVKVTVKKQADNLYVPVKLAGTYVSDSYDAVFDKFVQLIEHDLGIPRAYQHWSEG